MWQYSDLKATFSIVSKETADSCNPVKTCLVVLQFKKSQKILIIQICNKYFFVKELDKIKSIQKRLTNPIVLLKKTNLDVALE